MLDRELAVTYINPAAEQLFGRSERQVLGRTIADLIRPSGELEDMCRRALDTGLTFGLREFMARVGDRALSLDCRAAPMDDASGLLLELFDTERDRAVRREHELVAQHELSQRIVKALAHEVKNPLGGMRGAAQLLERRLGTDELKAYTRVIIDEADRLAALVDSILSAGGQSSPADTNLHEITEHVANLIVAEKPDGVAIVRDYDPSLPAIHVDRGQMIQAFLNLARNALAAVADGGTLVFRTRALSNFTIRGEQFRLVLSAEIEDDGPGIPEDLKETIFYPLISGRPTGTGLGLTIAQDLVSRNGGLVEFTSEPGRTVFQVRVPVAAGAGKESAG